MNILNFFTTYCTLDENKNVVKVKIHKAIVYGNKKYILNRIKYLILFQK